MRFQSASNVRDVVEQMRETDIAAHSFNRSKITQLFEGFPPFTEEEAEDEHLTRNINFLEAPSLAHKARSTWNNAFLKAGNRYKMTLDSGPIHKRGTWSGIINKEWNWSLKRNLRYIEATRGTGANVIMFGIGPKQWLRAKDWCPHELGVEDLLVPSNTKVNLENLAHFAVYRQYTPEMLFKATHGKQVDPGWQMDLVHSEMRRLTENLITTGQDSLQDVENPEKLIRAFKANAGVLDTDVVPTSNVWDFYHWEESETKEGEGVWYRSMILADSPTAEGKKDGFLYRSRRPYAKDRSQILHIQFGDGAQVSPFYYHTVRSLGFLLYAVCNLQNQLRCRFADAVFEATMQYFRVRNAEDRTRLRMVNLGHLGAVPAGLDFVRNDERWQIDAELVLAQISQNRQLLSENAAAFVQDVDQGTQKELTATEVMARLNSANALASSLLSMAYTYDRFEGMEIARRFCLKDTENPDIERFRRRCLEQGVPERYLNSAMWDIQPERVMGAGNKTLELAQAESLMNRLALFDPEAQQDIKREWVLATTDNPEQAEHWVPSDVKNVPPAKNEAQLAVGALMQGAPVDVRQGIDHVNYCEGMISSMESMVEDILVLVQHQHQPDPQQVLGLTNCYIHLVGNKNKGTIGHIQIVGQNPAEKERVRQWMDRLKAVMNYVKSWGQQIDEQRQAQNDQEAQAKIQATMALAKSKIQISQATSQQKMQQNELKFRADQSRKERQTRAQLQTQAVTTAAGVRTQTAKTAADIQNQAAKTEAEIAAIEAKTDADVKAKKKKAAAFEKDGDK